MQTITGNTYPVKEQIKALGGRWNNPAQGWDVPDAVAEQCKALVASAPVSDRPFKSRRSTGYRSGYTRFAGGGESFRNPRGRCEDAPACGCCSSY